MSNEFIIMYAPTFRQTISFDVFNNNYEKWISAFEKKTGRKCKLLFRLHPNIASLYKNIQIGENIINVSDYPDMQELLECRCRQQYIESRAAFAEICFQQAGGHEDKP